MSETDRLTTETLFKVLDETGRSTNGGDAQYYLPHGKRPGKWMPAIKGELIACENGYHVTTIDNVLRWAGPTLWVADARGERIDDSQKIVVSQVRLLHRVERWNDRVLRLFACRVAEDALRLVGNPDPRSVEAIRVARLFANGQATEDELTAAWAAARDAERDAAWVVARAAAWDAARDAAWAAVWAAQNKLLLQYLHGDLDD